MTRGADDATRVSAYDHFCEIIDSGGIVVLDAAMGTELQARGAPMDADAWCGLASLQDPELVRGVHEDHIAAGAAARPCIRDGLDAVNVMHTDELIELASTWVSLGARMLGGCCALRTQHVLALRRAVDAGLC